MIQLNGVTYGIRIRTKGDTILRATVTPKSQSHMQDLNLRSPTSKVGEYNQTTLMCDIK